MSRSVPSQSLDPQIRMAEEPHSPLPLDGPLANEFERFTLRGRRQIVQLLEELISHRCLITAHGSEGHAFMTVVLRVDEARERVALDASSDPQINRRALAANRLLCVTQIDGIRVNFTLTALSEAQERGHTVLYAPLPEQMLRLQRREFFRLQVPLVHALNCLLKAESLARKPVEVVARVIDIGAGGIAVLVPATVAEFVIGSVLEGCLLTLPDGEAIGVDLEVRNINHRTQRSGSEQLRVGLRFAALPRATETHIQRYILRTERDLNAKARGGL